MSTPKLWELLARYYAFIAFLLVLFIAGFALSNSGSYPKTTALAIGGSRTRSIAADGVSQPFSSTTGGVSYQGGPVMHDPKIYVIFWLPSNYTFEPNYLYLNFGSDARFMSLITQFFNDISRSQYLNILSQYYDGTNGAPQPTLNLSDYYVDTTPYPSTSLTYSQLQGEVANDMAVKGWHGGINSEFFIYTGCSTSGVLSHSCVQSPIESGFCAYHSFFTDSQGNVVIFSNIPDISGWGYLGCSDPFTSLFSPNNDLVADAEIAVTSHELFESISDPLVNAWYNPSLSEGEIGDLCNEQDGTVALSGHHFEVQKIWSNYASSCTTSYGPSTSLQILMSGSGASPTLPFKISYSENGISVWTTTTADTSNVTLYVDPLSDVYISGTTSGSSSERWCMNGCNNVTILMGYQSGYVNVNYVQQYYVDIVSQYGGLVSQSNWYNTGSTLQLNIAKTVICGSGCQYAFTSWGGSGAGAYTGTSSQSSIIVEGSITEVANWQQQYFLTINSANVAIPGSGWYNVGTSVTVTIPNSTEACGTGCRYLFNSWIGSGTGAYSGSSAAPKVIMNAPITETANWQQQYYLTIESAEGSASGSGWYNPGSTATFGISNQVAPCGSGCQYIFESWSGSGAGSYSGASDSSSVTINSPITETANWQQQYQLSTKMLGSGSVSPQSEWVDAGASVEISASANPGYELSNWSCTGNGCYSGTSSTATLVVNDPVTELADFVRAAITSSTGGGTSSSLTQTGTITSATHITTSVKTSSSSASESQAIQTTSSTGSKNIISTLNISARDMVYLGTFSAVAIVLGGLAIYFLRKR